MVGCSSGSGGSSKSAAVTPADVAKKLGCTASTESTEQLYVRELGKCTFNGAEVSLYTFTDNTARDSWLKIASGFGGKYDVMDRAIISSDDGTAVDAAQAKAGGTVH